MALRAAKAYFASPTKRLARQLAAARVMERALAVFGAAAETVAPLELMLEELGAAMEEVEAAAAVEEELEAAVEAVVAVVAVVAEVAVMVVEV